MKINDYERAKQMNLAASKCLQRKDYKGALEYFSEAIKFLPEDMLKAKAKLHSNRGHALVSIQIYEEALSSFKNAAEIFQKIEDKIRLGEQLGNIGSVQRDMEKWNDSLDTYFKALAIFKEMGHKEGIANQYSNIAYSYSRKGELTDAFQFFGKAKALYEGLEEHSKVQLCDQNLKAIRPYLKE